MKKKLHISPSVIALVFLFSVSNVKAQTHCTGSGSASGSSVCTPPTGLSVAGFYPSDTALPCAVVGQTYDNVISFFVPSTALGYTISHIVLKNITNMPCGLCWRSNNSSDQINGNSAGCVRITGTTYDAPGEYAIKPYADITVLIGGIVPLTLSGLNIDSLLGIKYFARVQLPGGTCLPVDTNSAGLTAHSAATPPTITLAGTTSICSGGSSTFSISNASGYYAYQWSTGATTSSISVSSAGTYTVTAYAGCSSATATRTLTVNTAPSPTITPSGATTFCSGGSVLLDAGTFAGGTFAWSNGATTQSINVSQTGNYIVTVTQNGCSGTASAVSVTVNANPAPTITPSGSTTFCSGGSVSLDAGANYSSYAWSSGETTQSITASQSGNYTVTVTQNGCTGTSNTITVTVTDPAPTVTASGTTTFCAGGSVTLDAGAGFDTYSWSDGSATQSILVTQSGSYVVTITQNSCVGISTPVAVTVGSVLSPVITATPSLNICTGGSATLDAGSGYDTYTWSTSDATQSIVESSAATYTVTVTQGACSGTASATLNVGNFAVPVSITPPGPVSACAGSVIPLDAGAGFDTYAWNTGDNTAAITADSTGNYIVTVTQSSCVGTASVSVNINPLPLITITPASPVTACAGDNVILDAGSGFASYTWSNGDLTETTQPATSATYHVTVTLNNCASSDSVVVTINPIPTVAITPASPVTACAGDNVILDAGSGFASYAWSNGATTQTIQPTSSTAYYVTVTQNNCSNTDSVDVTISPIPQASITPATVQPICAGSSVTLDAGAGFATYLWTNGETTRTIQATDSASYSVTVTQNGCTGVSSNSVNVAVNPIPFAQIDATNGVNLHSTPSGGTYQWFYIDNSNQSHALATTQDYVIPSGSQYSGNYYVVVTVNGCTDTSDAYTYIAAGVSDLAAEIKFGMMPNPANDVLNISYDLKKTSTVVVSILDLTGRKITEVLNETESAGTHNHPVQVSQLAQGIYMVNFATQYGNFNAKFVKQ